MATLTRAFLPDLPQGPAMAPRPPLGARLLLVLPLLCPPLAPTRAHRFLAPNTTLNRLALAPGRGALYVGAVNRLFQLSPALRLESVAVTGPVLDSPDCVPFRDPAECPQARLTDNANQLLLVSGRARELVACGQVRQGVCEKRRLEDVAQLLYWAEDPGDGQFVAANAAGVATVGLVVPGPGRDLLLVARGLAGKLSGGVPPLTVRQLAGPQPFSSEGLGRLVVGDLSDYNNSYVAALADARSAYFVFRRRGARAQAEYRSYVARVCLGDANLYSYVEVPLTCRGHGLIQAASLAPGALLGAFAAGPRGAQAALCAFPLADLDATMERARRLCYTTGGRGPGGTEEATVEYGVTSRCVTLPPDSPESYPCGDEHTPSPIAGRQPLEAGPLLQLGNSISAVAALRADGHTIAFLGDVQGQLHKVFLNGTRGQVYHSQQVGPPGSAISPDLLVDSSGSHVYVLTSQQVDRVPVAACPQFPDCSSCLQARDPLCGWCVLQGRCTRKGQCGRAAQPNQWLWSYEDGRCLHIQSLLPAHRPRQEQGQVALSVPRLPTLTVDEYFHCAFGGYDSLAHVEGTHVACVTPPQDQLPHNPPGTEHITLPLALMFEDVVVATTNFSFYDCSAVQALEAAAPCGACVGSLWRCHWCPQSSRCVYGERCPEGERTIYSAQQADSQVRGPGACPRVEGLVGPLLVPVGWESRLALRVRNLQHFRGLPAAYHCWLELPGELQRLPASLEEVAGDAGLIHCQAQQFQPSMAQPELPVPIYVTRGEGQRLDNARTLHVTLYDCAVGHPDCSHCQAANGSLGCLWCSHDQPTCRYGPLCPPGAVEPLCPTPSIDSIEPLTGPPEGGLALTILGSNLGRDFADVQDAVSVAGRPCSPDPSLYRISARREPVCPEAIVCHTTPQASPGEAVVRVVFGRAQRTLLASPFHYTADPQLVAAEPSVSFRGPAVPEGASPRRVFFALDNVHVDFARASGGQDFLYQPNPRLAPLGGARPYRLKPGHILDVEGEGLNLGISKEEVRVHIGDGECLVKTLTPTHLYCEPPPRAPQPTNGSRPPPQFVVQMGNVRLPLGPVQYEAEPALSAFPVEAQVGLGLGAAVLIAAVLLLTLMYRHKSKQALRDYQKVLVQLENLEIGVGDQCRKEFTDLMTEMTDLSSDLEASGIPFLDYRTYAERVFFPGRGRCPLQPALEAPGEEGRRAPVRQGLMQLSNLLNSKLFLLTLVHTLEEQPSFSQRDRCLVASLLSLALHGKLEYLTDIMKTLLGDLATHYVQKNPKLMLRRTETMAEKLLTNWVSICLYAFLREVAAEPLYVLLRAIQYQVDKGPVDAVTGKAKRTLNDSRLLREDVEFRPLTLMVLAGPGAGGAAGGSAAQRVPARVLDTDTITQVKEKVLDQVYKGTPFSQRPSVHALDLGENPPLLPHPRLFSPVATRLCPTGTGCGLTGFPGSPQEWRSGLAGHLTLSDEDLTSVTQDRWKRLNTLQHYKVPDGATVRLIPQLHNGGAVSQSLAPSCPSGENIPMLEDSEEGGVRLWHLVKVTDEPEAAKARRSSLRERERERARAKAIPEIYLTRLLSMKGTLQKFVDDAFQAILSVNRPVPIAVKYLFDFLDELADKHGIEDPETLHIWKTNRCPACRPRAERTLPGQGQQGRDRSPGLVAPGRPRHGLAGQLPVRPRAGQQAERGSGSGVLTPRLACVPSLLLRFWVNTLKNPQLIFDVRVSDNVDAVLAVIAQTFMDSCTISEHKVGRVRAEEERLAGEPRRLGAEPWVGLGGATRFPREQTALRPGDPSLQADGREVGVGASRTREWVPPAPNSVPSSRYYSDIRQSSPASYQEMNSALAELSGNYTSAPHCLEALQELYTHIHRYYDQIISALEEDPVGQKMQLACRLQQIAALVENKVTDL
eukprot:bmy_18759T0